MSKIKSAAIVLLFFGVCHTVLAQKKCGSMDLLRHQLNIKNDDELTQFKQQLNQATQKNSATKNREVFTIPVVVHVLYRTVSENIEDDIIYEALAVINEDFRALNNLSNIFEEFQDDAADAEIEFCLANMDPNGNPTKGINRIKTEVTDFGDNYAEDKIKFTSKGGADAWPTKRYLNIWIGNISNDGLLGYAQFPNGGGINTDGIVIDDRSFGRVGGSGNVNDDGTTTHEIGHWLGLFHIWGDDCSTDNNGVEICRCDGDDGIADTNTAKGPAFGCTKQMRSCGSADMIQNYMDYSSCSDFFTQGQVDVMRSYLESGGFRSGLVNSSGCAELITNDVALVDIEFPAKNEVVCVQDFSPVIEFANNGSDTLKQATFKILINDNREFTTDWSGELLFADYATIKLSEITGNIGSQKITIQVQSVNGEEDLNTNNDLVEHNFQVKILEAERLPFREDFEGEFGNGKPQAFDENKWTATNEDSDEGFIVTNEIAHFGEQCLELNNFTIRESGRIDELISQNLDIASYTEPVLKFYYASANRRTEPGFDELQVLFTNDCGVHFDTLFHAIGDDLATTAKTDDAFKPVNSQWKRVTIDLDAYKDEAFANIHFKFISGLGNNFFLDDITVTGKDPTFSSIFDSPADFNIQISPNPFQQQIYLAIPNEYLSKRIHTIIYDPLGRQLKNTSINKPSTQITIEVADIPSGIYYLHLQIDRDVHLIQKMIKL